MGSVICLEYGFRTKKNINEDNRKGLLRHKRETSSETTNNRTPGLPRFVDVDAADEVDAAGAADDVDEVEFEVPLRAIARFRKAEKLRADVSSELIAKTMP